MTTVQHALRMAFLTSVRALNPALIVVNGPQISDDPSDVLMVGIRDPYSLTPSPGVSSTQDVATMGRPRTRDERGEIWSSILCRDGGADVDVCYTRAYAYLAQVENLIRTASQPGDPLPPLGVAGVITVGIEHIEAIDDSDDLGVWSVLAFSLTYRARI